MNRSRAGEMRTCVKRCVRASLSLASVTAARVGLRLAGSNNGLRILMYHDVGDPAGSPDPFCVPTALFREHARILRDAYTVVALEDGIAGLNGERELPPRSVVVTFDDGYRGVLENAAPILQEFRMPAITYLRCDVMEDGFVPELPKSGRRAYLTWSEAKTLPERGIAIGAHTVSHRSLARIPAERMRAEIVESKRMIEGALGNSVRSFAFPYGTGADVNADVIRAVRDAGFLDAVTAINGCNYANASPFTLRRTKVEGHDSLDTFARLLQGGLDLWALVDRWAPPMRRRRV